MPEQLVGKENSILSLLRQHKRFVASLLRAFGSFIKLYHRPTHFLCSLDIKYFGGLFALLAC